MMLERILQSLLGLLLLTVAAMCQQVRLSSSGLRGPSPQPPNGALSPTQMARLQQTMQSSRRRPGGIPVSLPTAGRTGPQTYTALQPDRSTGAVAVRSPSPSPTIRFGGGSGGSVGGSRGSAFSAAAGSSPTGTATGVGLQAMSAAAGTSALMRMLDCEHQCPPAISRLQMVCATSGDSFDSMCRLECSRQTLLCHGECPCSMTSMILGQQAQSMLPQASPGIQLPTLQQHFSREQNLLMLLGAGAGAQQSLPQVNPQTQQAMRVGHQQIQQVGMQPRQQQQQQQHQQMASLRINQQPRSNFRTNQRSQQSNRISNQRTPSNLRTGQQSQTNSRTNQQQGSRSSLRSQQQRSPSITHQQQISPLRTNQQQISPLRTNQQSMSQLLSSLPQFALSQAAGLAGESMMSQPAINPQCVLMCNPGESEPVCTVGGISGVEVANACMANCMNRVIMCHSGCPC